MQLDLSHDELDLISEALYQLSIIDDPDKIVNDDIKLRLGYELNKQTSLIQSKIEQLRINHRND